MNCDEIPVKGYDAAPGKFKPAIVRYLNEKAIQNNLEWVDGYLICWSV